MSNEDRKIVVDVQFEFYPDENDGKYDNTTDQEIREQLVAEMEDVFQNLGGDDNGLWWHFHGKEN